MWTMLENVNCFQQETVFTNLMNVGWEVRKIFLVKPNIQDMFMLINNVLSVMLKCPGCF